MFECGLGDVLGLVLVGGVGWFRDALSGVLEGTVVVLVDEFVKVFVFDVMGIEMFVEFVCL